MAVEEFKVARQHLGDRLYLPGDTREANAGDVEHLLRNGVLVRQKAEPAPKNKAEKVPPNKGE